MASHRFEIDAAAGPARGSLVGGGAMLLVRVRLFDGPGVVDGGTGLPTSEQDVYTDLRPDAARTLAARLVSCAEQAEQLTARANRWQR